MANSRIRVAPRGGSSSTIVSLRGRGSSRPRSSPQFGHSLLPVFDGTVWRRRRRRRRGKYRRLVPAERGRRRSQRQHEPTIGSRSKRRRRGGTRPADNEVRPGQRSRERDTAGRFFFFFFFFFSAAAAARTVVRDRGGGGRVLAAGGVAPSCAAAAGGAAAATTAGRPAFAVAARAQLATAITNASTRLRPREDVRQGPGKVEGENPRRTVQTA